MDYESTKLCHECRKSKKEIEDNLTTEQQLQMMGYGTQVPDPTALLTIRVAKFICHTCLELVCRECLFEKHRDISPEGVSCDFEPIDEFKIRVRQTVFLINSKLDISITKLKFAQAQYLIASRKELEETVAKESEKRSQEDISIGFVIQMSQELKTHSTAALKQMSIQSSPYIFKKFLDEIQSLYEL